MLPEYTATAGCCSIGSARSNYCAAKKKGQKEKAQTSGPITLLTAPSYALLTIPWSLLLTLSRVSADLDDINVMRVRPEGGNWKSVCVNWGETKWEVYVFWVQMMPNLFLLLLPWLILIL